MSRNRNTKSASAHTIVPSKVSVNLADGIFSAQGGATPDPPAQELKKVNTVDYQDAFNTEPVLYWGEGNDFPDKLIKAARISGILKQGLKVRNQLMYDQGIITYKEIPGPDGNPVMQIVQDKKVNAWLKKINVNKYLREAARDYDTYGNVFPVLQLNASRKIVSAIKVRSARFCRLEKPHPSSGVIENVYESAQWVNGIAQQFVKGEIPKSLSQWIYKYRLLDTEEAVEVIRADKKRFNFALHLKDASCDTDYGEAPWHATYLNGWLEISSSVPQLKKRLFLYAMTINYIIYIDDDYWTTVFGKEFTKWSAAEKEEKIKEVQDSIEDNLLGKDNSWKSIFAAIKYTADGKEKKSILIEAIDNKLREGTFIPDNLHANGEIVAALGIDACLFGATVFGDKVSAGSGSNIREARLNTIGMMQLDRDILLEPIAIGHEYMGFDPEIKYGIKAFVINTLDGRDPAKPGKATTA